MSSLGFRARVGSLICGGGVRDCVAYSAQFRARLPSFKIQPVAKSEPGKNITKHFIQETFVYFKASSSELTQRVTELKFSLQAPWFQCYVM